MQPSPVASSRTFSSSKAAPPQPHPSPRRPPIRFLCPSFCLSEALHTGWGGPHAPSPRHHTLADHPCGRGRGCLFLFYGLILFHHVGRPHAAGPLTRSWAVGCLCFLAAVISVQAFVGASVFSSSKYLRGSGIARRFATFNPRSCQTVFHDSCSVLRPHRQCGRAPHSCHCLLLSASLVPAARVGVRWCVTVV